MRMQCSEEDEEARELQRDSREPCCVVGML